MALRPAVGTFFFFDFVYKLDMLAAVVLRAAGPLANFTGFQEVPQRQFSAFCFIEFALECLSELTFVSVGFVAQLLDLVQINAD